MRTLDKTDLLIAVVFIAVMVIVWWISEVRMEKQINEEYHESEYDKELKYQDWLKRSDVKSKDTINEFLEDEVKKFDKWEKENK